MCHCDNLAGRGIEALPTGAGQVNFRPCVGCALALRERGRVKVAADKARRQPKERHASMNNVAKSRQEPARLFKVVAGV